MAGYGDGTAATGSPFHTQTRNASCMGGSPRRLFLQLDSHPFGLRGRFKAFLAASVGKIKHAHAKNTRTLKTCAKKTHFLWAERELLRPPRHSLACYTNVAYASNEDVAVLNEARL